jgi:signal transduction histidine kinase
MQASLRGKFLRITIPLIFLSVIAVFGVIELMTHRNAIQRTEQAFEAMARTQAAALANPLWNLDRDQISLSLEAIVTNREVLLARVIGEGGQPVASAGIVPASARTENLRRISRAIQFDAGAGARTIGKLEFVGTLQYVWEQTWGRLLIAAAIALVAVLIEVAAALYALRTIIGRPLERLLLSINAREAGGVSQPVAWNSEDELGQVISAYNEMQSNQSVYESDLRKARDTLEKRVKERTAELTAARDESVRTRTRLQDALESTSEGFAFFDAGEKLVTANSRYRDFFLRDVQDVVKPGIPMETILKAVVEHDMVAVPIGGKAWLDWRLKRFRQPDGPFSVEYRDGRWVQVNERKTGDGGTVVIYSDITELKEREFQLTRARDEAEAASETKSTFLANVSHELRTPLTSILGFARIVQKRFETAVLPLLSDRDTKTERAIGQITGNLEIMLTEGDRLTKLINDVLDLEKIEAGEMVWQIGPLEIGEVIDQAAAATRSLYEQKGLTFATEAAPDLPRALGDRDRIVQVLVNLISNAIKFTEEGHITCRAWSEDGTRISVSVSDTGAGIAPEDQAASFQKFRQVGDTLTEKPSGTGLGLPICREIIEHLGGMIWVESTKGKGSTFGFWLPAESQRVGGSGAEEDRSR